MADKTTWRIQGEAINTCNCNWGCPCQFNSLPSKGKCEAFVGFRIDSGSFGDTPLEGMRVAGVYSWPGAIHEGNGTCQPVIDDRASPAQREALLRILSGKEGCAFFEIFASMVSTVLPPKFQPIEFELDREKRVGRLASADVGEAIVEPIKNLVTGAEHRAVLSLPNGFEFKEAELASAASVHARAGDHVLDLTNTHAHVNRFDWGNA